MNKEEREARAWKEGAEELGLLNQDDDRDKVNYFLNEKMWKQASEFCRGIIVTASYQGKNLTEDDMIDIVRKRYEELG